MAVCDVCTIEEPDSIQNVELSGELSGSKSRSLKERFMAVTLLTKFSRSKSQPRKVYDP